MFTDDISSLRKQFDAQGWVIADLEHTVTKTTNLRSIFLENFVSRFTTDVQRNRNLIKRFADSPAIHSLFASFDVQNAVKRICSIDEPVFCGPLVSHYTSENDTGGGYRLPFHQDYPSMASSITSVICWFNLVDSGPNSHGIEILSGLHKSGVFPGTNRKDGFIMDGQEWEAGVAQVPEVKAGSLLLMSSFLPHRTYFKEGFKGWKLSLSRRIDDLDDSVWDRLGYRNAYSTVVDRDMYLT